LTVVEGHFWSSFATTVWSPFSLYIDWYR
jgi:hypothetical protein